MKILFIKLLFAYQPLSVGFITFLQIAMTIVCLRFRQVLEDRYSIMIMSAEGQSRDDPATPEQFLNALACKFFELDSGLVPGA